MMRMKNSEFRVKKLVITFCISFLTLHSTLLTPVLAADSSPSADIRTKLEELKKEIASKAAQLKQIVNKKLKDKAYTGKIKSHSDSSLTLATDSGAKLVSINQDTVFSAKSKSKTKFSQKSLQEENFIAALGDTDEVGVLTARNIILLTPPNEPKTYLWGQVTNISDNLITIKDRASKNITVLPPTVSGIKLNDFVILTGKKDSNDVFKAGFLYVIPQGGIIKTKKVATPAAQISSPSGKLKKN